MDGYVAPLRKAIVYEVECFRRGLQGLKEEAGEEDGEELEEHGFFLTLLCILLFVVFRYFFSLLK